MAVLRSAFAPFRRSNVLMLGCAAALLTGCGASNGERGPDATFDRIAFAEGGGLPGPREDGDECEANRNDIAVDARADSVSWNLCRFSMTLGHNVLARGQRTLTASELTSLRSAVAGLEVGSGGACLIDAGWMTLEVEAAGRVDAFRDDSDGCNPPPSGFTLVRNMRTLRPVVFALAPANP